MANIPADDARPRFLYIGYMHHYLIVFIDLFPSRGLCSDVPCPTSIPPSEQAFCP